MLAAGGWLERAGHPVFLLRLPDRPLPPGVEGPWGWPALRRVTAPARTHPRALTVSPQFGVSSAPERAGPLGRAGPWAAEVEAVERAYGREGTLHVSLEEFARTLTASAQVEERYREGGVSSRARARARGMPDRRHEIVEARILYRRFREFERPNLLTVFPTFRRSDAFAREFPEAVQTGPLRPDDPPVVRRARHGPVQVLWYASPSSSGRLVPGLAAALAAHPGGAVLTVRSPRPLPFPRLPGVVVRSEPPRSPEWWRAQWRSTDLAIVTGSRSLLEALHHGVPFLYYNGVMAVGRCTRRHRPEKLLGLLELLRDVGAPPSQRRELAGFSLAREVEATLRRSLRGARRPVRERPWSVGFVAPYREANDYLVTVAARFAEGSAAAPALVALLRREQRDPAPSQV